MKHKLLQFDSVITYKGREEVVVFVVVHLQLKDLKIIFWISRTYYKCRIINNNNILYSIFRTNLTKFNVIMLKQTKVLKINKQSRVAFKQ